MPSEIIVSSDGVAPTLPGLDLWVDTTTPASMQQPSIPAFSSVAARDAAWPTPYSGALCVTTDTGTMWQYIGNMWWAPFGRVNQYYMPASINGIGSGGYDMAGTTATYPAGRRIKVLAHILMDGNATYPYCYVKLDGASQGHRLWQMQNFTNQILWEASITVTPSAGSHTITIGFVTTTGTINLTTGYCYYEIWDAGAA